MLVAQGIVEEEGEEEEEREEGATREANQRRRPRRVVQNTHNVNGVVVQRDLWSGQGSCRAAGLLVNSIFVFIWCTLHDIFFFSGSVHTS